MYIIRVIDQMKEQMNVVLRTITSLEKQDSQVVPVEVKGTMTPQVR